VTPVALVTGGARGIGAAIAVRLAAGGFDVAVADVRDAAETVVAIESRGRRALALACDVRDDAAVQAAVAATEEHLGPLAAAVQVAGVWEAVPFLDLDPAGWRRVLDVNLDGTFHVCRHAARAMAQRQSGAIVCISSNAAGLVWAGGVHYTVSKAGVVGLVKGMAYELGPLGIRVNAVCPGTIETPATAAELADPAARMRQAASVPLGRIGRPGDVAEAVAFLVDPVRASFISGEALYVDGAYGTHGDDAGFGGQVHSLV